MPKARTTLSKKPKRLDSEEHHCSQCNRPTLHEVYEHEDGVTMKCPCGYEFVDVRADAVVDTVVEVGADDGADQP